MTAAPPKAVSILIADDVVEIQQLVAHWLEPLGYRVFGASSGEDALRRIGREPCDVAIVDVLMPDGDGLDVIRELKARHRGVRILAISGGGKYMAAPECIKLAHGLGADGVLLKPFKEAQLIDALAAVLA